MAISTGSATTELDPMLKSALKLLHSSATDSAEKLRNMLDEIIKQKHGSSKMLANTLSSKYLKEESSAPGTKTVKKVQPKTKPMEIPEKPLSISSSSSSSPSYEISEETNQGIPETPIDTRDTLFEGDDDIFKDLVCVVCRRMESTSRNRLVECSDCHSLYHQECHKPIISEQDANNQEENNWFCTLCKNKVPEAVPASTSVASSPAKPSKPTIKNYESSSSSSSSSSSFKKAKAAPKTSDPPVKSKEEIAVENVKIKIVSGSDRLKAIKKSSKSHSHDSKRKGK